MKVVIVVQARMLSDRLPGKILKKVNGKPLLTYQLEALKRVSNAHQVVVATGRTSDDDPVALLCEILGIPCHRGSDNDVLERFFEAAQRFEADVVVRQCADCPLMDTKIVEQVIGYFLNQYPRYDYVSNILERTFPRGMDTEVLTFKALTKAHKEGKTRPEREHVTYYIYTHPDSFKLGSITHNINLGYYRWTVDTPEDFQLIEKILIALHERRQLPSLENILALFQEHPQWIHLNRHIQQKPV